MIAALPLLFLLVVGATDPAALAFLVTSSLGRTCLALGVGLQGIGFWWMQRIVQAIGAVADHQGDLVPGRAGRRDPSRRAGRRGENDKGEDP